MGAIRLVGFLVSALGVEMARGVGLAALGAALLAGLVRLHPAWLATIAAGGVTGSLLLPEGVDGAGKVGHGLSNAPFVLFLYLALTLSGYVIGRVLRAIAGR